MYYSGINFDCNVGVHTITIQTASLSIEDNSAPATERGQPTGHMLDGSVAADGELVVTTPNLKTLISEARRAGSWRNMPLIDVSFYASKGNDDIKIEAFGCLLKLEALLDIDATEGGESVTHTIPYQVCGEDFVHIDGVRYIDRLT